MTELTNSLTATHKRKIVAEIISIGDEICSGAILDTNSQFISASLSEIGAQPLYHTTVADNEEAMLNAFALAFRRADVIVCTGGLGPTQDDLTRVVAAKTLGVELRLDPDSLEHTKSLFLKRGRVMPESNLIQAYFPEGSRVIFNPNGTAPGFIIEESRDILAPLSTETAQFKAGSEIRGDFIALFFPGVPAELKEMWVGDNGREAIRRFISKVTHGAPTFYRTKKIHSFGLGESAVEERLPNLIARDRFPLVGITAKDSVITLRIFAEGKSEQECDEQIADISKIIYDRVGEYVFGEDDETFPQVFSRNLRAQAIKVGVFEWGTQGAFAKRLDSEVLGFGHVFGDGERDLFHKLFGDSSPSASTSAQRADASTFSASSFEETTLISPLLKQKLAEFSQDERLLFCLAIGPYPREEELREAAKKNQPAPSVDVVFLDLRDAQAPKQRRERFVFGGQPAMIDALFCNRAMAELLNNQ